MEQLLNGRFEYEVPHLLLSETEVALTLDEGQNFRGELNIGAEDGRRVKGIVTTDHQRIVLAKNQFQGTASTIEYGVDTSGLKAGDEILLNVAEHASNTLPWFDVAEETGAVVKYIELDEEGRMTLDNVKKAVTENTKIISLAIVTNVLGYEVPIKEITEYAHSKGIIVVACLLYTSDAADE